MERIRTETGTSAREVRSALVAAGLPAKLGGLAFPQLYDEHWVREQLAHSGVTEVARSLGCSVRSVNRSAARRAGVPGRRRIPIPALLDDVGWLSLQLERRRTYADLASELGCSEKAVRRAVSRHGLGELARRRRRFPELYDEDWLRAASATQSRAEIAAQLGCSVEAVKAAQHRMKRQQSTVAISVCSGEQPAGHVPRP